MSDEQWTPFAKPAPPKLRVAEKRFEFLRGHDRFLCELVDQGQWGIEAVFFKNEELYMSRRWQTRAQALAWTQHERIAIERDSGSSEML